MTGRTTPAGLCRSALGQGLVNHVGGALHQTALVGVLNAQDEGAPGVPGDDAIFGDITVENKTLDDQVLIKRDGMPPRGDQPSRAT